MPAKVLDLTRGKPSDEQVRLSFPMLDIDVKDPALGNYGYIDGLPMAREFFASMFKIDVSNTIVLGDSSLTLMEMLVKECLVRTVPGASGSWRALPYHVMNRRPAIIIPTPSYDRYHNICRLYGIDMIAVPYTDEGPDMEMVEELVSTRPEIVGMFCIPVYSNPNGITYSAWVCQRLARMRVLNPGFRLIWDLAYVVHHLTRKEEGVPNMLDLCDEAGHPDRVLMVVSTSKITMPDAGISALGASLSNLNWVRESLFVRTIGQNKQNQVRTVRFLKDMEGLKLHMARHRELLRPKFELIETTLQRRLGHRGVASWNLPHGGYFVGLTLVGKSAREVVTKAALCGLKLTPADACDPHGKDDSFLRLAPTYAPLQDLRPALEILCDAIDE